MSIPNSTANEPEWTQYLANSHAELQGEAEYRTPDGSYVDIVTKEYAVEVEWPKKWKEAVGQALFYSCVTGLKPAIAMLVRNKPSEKLYFARLMLVCNEYNIKIFFVKTR